MKKGRKEFNNGMKGIKKLALDRGIESHNASSEAVFSSTLTAWSFQKDRCLLRRRVLMHETPQLDP